MELVSRIELLKYLEVRVKNVNKNTTATWTRNNVTLFAGNNIVVYHGSHEGNVECGCLVGIKIKRILLTKDMFQAAAEYLSWGVQSLYHFVQLVTDMVSGCIVIYPEKHLDEGKTQFTKHYVTMEDLVEFFKDLVGACGHVPYMCGAENTHYQLPIKPSSVHTIHLEPYYCYPSCFSFFLTMNLLF